MMDHNRIIVGGYSWIEVENLIGVSPSIHGLLIRPPDDNREFSGLLVPPVIIHDHQWTNCEKNRADELETRPTRNTSFRPIFSTRILRPATSLLFSRFLLTKSLRIDARDRIPNSKTLLDKILHVRRTRKTRKNSNNRQDVINSNKNSWLTGDSTRLDSFDRPSPSIVPVIGRKDGSFFSSLPLFLPSFLPPFLSFFRPFSGPRRLQV